MFEGYIDKVQVVRLMEDYVPKDEKNEKAVGITSGQSGGNSLWPS